MKNLPTLINFPGPKPTVFGLLTANLSIPLKGDLPKPVGIEIPISFQKKPRLSLRQSSVFSPKSSDFGSKKEVMSRLFFWTTYVCLFRIVDTYVFFSDEKKEGIGYKSSYLLVLFVDREPADFQAVIGLADYTNIEHQLVTECHSLFSFGNLNPFPDYGNGV